MADQSLHQLAIQSMSRPGPINNPGLGITALTQNILWGSSIGSQFFGDKDYLIYAMNELRNGIATSESNMAPRHIQPTQGVFSGYPAVDLEIAQAASVGAGFRGFPLVDGDNNPAQSGGASPSWLTPACSSAGATLSVLNNTITNEMTHWKGKFKQTCVVNESQKPFGNPGNFVPNPFNVWLPGSDPVNGYIAKALRITRSVDGSTKLGLHYNHCETANSGDTNNQNAILSFVELLIQNGTPLDYIAPEGHLNGLTFLSDFGNGSQFKTFLQNLISLGLFVGIAELDCNTVGCAGDSASQDNIVSNCIGTFLDAILPIQGLQFVSNWEFPDKWSWYNNQTPGVASSGPSRGDNLTQRVAPLDWNYSPKKVYFTIVNSILTSGRVVTPPPPPPPTPILTTIQLTPINPSVNVGGTIQFNVSGKDQFQNAFSLAGLTILIGSSDNSIFNVDLSTFIGTANMVGGVTVTATVQGGPKDTTTVQVTPVPVGPLAQIIISPINAIVAIGAQVQYSAIGVDSNGVVLSPQPTFNWSSGTPQTGNIDSILGLFIAVMAGVSVISVNSGSITNTTTIAVMAPVPPPPPPPNGGGGTGGTTPVTPPNSTPYGSGPGCNPFIRYAELPRDPITGLIDWALANQLLDEYDFHASPFVQRYNNTVGQMTRDLGPSESDQSTASLNEQAWAKRQLDAGIPLDGILGKLS